jgi:hypothetical protein
MMGHLGPTGVRIAAGAVLSVVFVAGLLLGFALDPDLVARSAEGGERVGDRRGDFSPPPPGGWFIDRLEMTDAQRAEVDSIVSHFTVHMGDLQREYRPRFMAVVDSVNDALRAVLTPPQLAEYDSLAAALRARRGRGGNPQRPR